VKEGSETGGREKEESKKGKYQLLYKPRKERKDEIRAQNELISTHLGKGGDQSEETRAQLLCQ